MSSSPASWRVFDENKIPQGSYSFSGEDTAEVRVEQQCKRCHGTGSVILHGQDVDCEDCEGWGSYLI